MAASPVAAKARAGFARERKIMDLGGFNWSLITIVGPLLLAVVLLWAFLRNKASSQSEIDRTEEATRDLYDREEAKRADGDDRTA
jgi:hypothetical protein